eukprot:14124475-Heterocapsa_arctica.AAC.1
MGKQAGQNGRPTTRAKKKGGGGVVGGGPAEAKEIRGAPAPQLQLGVTQDAVCRRRKKGGGVWSPRRPVASPLPPAWSHRMDETRAG